MSMIKNRFQFHRKKLWPRATANAPKKNTFSKGVNFSTSFSQTNIEIFSFFSKITDRINWKGHCVNSDCKKCNELRTLTFSNWDFYDALCYYLFALSLQFSLCYFWREKSIRPVRLTIKHNFSFSFTKPTTKPD